MACRSHHSRPTQRRLHRPRTDLLSWWDGILTLPLVRGGQEEEGGAEPGAFSPWASTGFPSGTLCGADSPTPTLEPAPGLRLSHCRSLKLSTRLKDRHLGGCSLAMPTEGQSVARMAMKIRAKSEPSLYSRGTVRSAGAGTG